jgi:predicted nuclease of restriction endonuclease-like (RecB) superfamily
VAQRKTLKTTVPASDPDYGGLVATISVLIEQSRRYVARAVNGIITSTYWSVGLQIVEYEQGGKARAVYGEALINRLAEDLAARYGRGYSPRNLRQMRAFYLGWRVTGVSTGRFAARAARGITAERSDLEIWQTLSAEFPFTKPNTKAPVANGRRKRQTPSAKSPTAPTMVADLGVLVGAFPLSWSHYVRLLSVSDLDVRAFYEAEAIRGGWSVRQLDRQVSTLFYERTALSKRKAAMLEKGRRPKAEDAVSIRDEIRDPYLLEFIDLKDEYSENDLEDALVRHLEWFLLEMGSGFTFVARQKRIRVGDAWYRIDLLLYHRGLRCLVIVDLKTGAFTHADAGQMNLYLNYVREHLTLPGEADPVGIILCSDKDDAVVHYATGGIASKVFATRYRISLPDEETLKQEILETQRVIETRAAAKKALP